MSNLDPLLSSKSTEWETPQLLFDELNRQFNFHHDVACTPQNQKAPPIAEDALIVPWEGRCFMNPPYGKDIKNWVRKAYNEVIAENADIVVALVPARVDTAWFNDYCAPWLHRHIRGRLKFELNGKPILDKHGRPVSAPFPSTLVYMGL